MPSGVAAVVDAVGHAALHNAAQHVCCTPQRAPVFVVSVITPVLTNV